MKQTKYIYLTILFLIIVFVVSGAILTEKRHRQKMYTVEEKKILEAADKCKLEDVCLDSTVSLQFLYDHYYLVEQANPISKKNYNSNLVVDYTKKSIDWITN